METQFYGDGQHNGGSYFWGNNNPYIYTYQNPIIYVDPNGKQTKAQATKGYRPGIPIPVFKKGDYYTPFPIIDGAEKKVREGFDQGSKLHALSILAFTAVTIEASKEEFDIVKNLANRVLNSSSEFEPTNDKDINKEVIEVAEGREHQEKRPMEVLKFSEATKIVLEKRGMVVKKTG